MPRDTAMLIFPSFCKMLKSSWSPDQSRLLRADFTPNLHQEGLPHPLYYKEHWHEGLALCFIIVHLLLVAHFLLSGKHFNMIDKWLQNEGQGVRRKLSNPQNRTVILFSYKSPRSRGWAQCATCCCLMSRGAIVIPAWALQLCLLPRFQLFDNWWQTRILPPGSRLHFPCWDTWAF